jgi:hypothetical protein
MPADDLMDDFAPAPDRPVTLSNWRKAPFSAWGFRNVRRLIPTANIAASADPVGLEMSLEEVGHIGFTGHDGHPTTVGQALRATRTDAFVVLRRGRIAAEWYDNGMDATTPHIVFSVSKSICGTPGGILAGRGLLDPDDRVIDYVPELASSVYADCTTRHLLDMAVGIAFNEDYDDPKGDEVRPDGTDHLNFTIRRVRLGHAARHEAPDRDFTVKPHRPNHRASCPVRFGDQGVVGNIDPVVLEADSIVAVLGLPIRICDAFAIRHRAAKSFAAREPIEPGFKR